MRFRSRLVVDLNILAQNVSHLRELFPSQEILFMVKADAYGHGVLPIVRYCVENLNIREYGCATIGEAISLRENLSDLEFEVYVFSDVQIELKDCTEIYLQRRIIPVLSNFSDLEYMLSHSDLKNFPLCLKFNTGMNRLGLDYEKVDEVIELIKKYQHRKIFHLMTHFSSSSHSMNSNKRNIEQRERFAALKEKIKAAGIEIERTSLSNSGAIEQGVGKEETHIRPGLLLYGPSCLVAPLRGISQWKGRVISQLESYIINVFPVTKGQPIGYGASPVAEAGVIAIVAIGYGDGFPTRFAGATLHHKGYSGKVVGRVNMDMAQVWFPTEALDDIVVGDKFIIWNHSQSSVLNLSDETQTLTYELFCQLTPRVPRIHQV